MNCIRYDEQVLAVDHITVYKGIGIYENRLLYFLMFRSKTEIQRCCRYYAQ